MGVNVRSKAVERKIFILMISVCKSGKTTPFCVNDGRLRRSTASVFSASSAIGDELAESRSKATGNLAKDAHRGRHGTSCPAMTPLRFCRGSRRPCTPRKRRALYPSFLGKKFLQSILLTVQGANPASRGAECVA